MAYDMVVLVLDVFYLFTWFSSWILLLITIDICNEGKCLNIPNKYIKEDFVNLSISSLSLSYISSG